MTTTVIDTCMNPVAKGDIVIINEEYGWSDNYPLRRVVAMPDACTLTLCAELEYWRDHVDMSLERTLTAEEIRLERGEI